MKETILKIIMNEVPSATSEHYFDKFEVSPKTYFSFAKTDFEQGNDKGYVNATNNIKMGIDCQIDTLLTIFDYMDKANRENWNFQRKVEFLEKLNFTSQKINKSILKLKNMIKPDYKQPEKKSTHIALRVFEDFISETENYIKNLTDFQFDVSLHEQFNNNVADDLMFQLKYKNNDFHIFHLDKEILKITKEDENYFPFFTKYVEYWKNI